MKKIAFLSILTGLFMVGCTEMAQPADPQSNAQEELVTITGAVTATAVPTIDLAKVEVDTVKVADLATEITASEESELQYYLTINDTYEYEIPADTLVQLPVAELKTIVEEVYGKRPVERKLSAVVTVAAVVRGSAVLYKSEKFDVTVIPEAPFIDEAYYLVGDMAAWDAAGALKFAHSGADVYEDPVFSIVFSTTKENSYWKIIPAGNYGSADSFWTEGPTGVVGVETDGDTALEGKLVAVAGVGAGVVSEVGMYKMTINMMDYTYTIKAIAPEYYILGDVPFGWDVNVKKFLMYAESKTVHSYTTNFKGNVKMINSNDMGTDNWDACYGTPTDGSTAENGALVSDGGAIHVPEEGWYTLKADYKEMTYTWTKIEEPTAEYESIGIVGSFNDWNQASDDMQLTEVAPHNWAKYNVVIGEKGSTYLIKFNADKAWAVSWGGAVNFDDNSYGVLAEGADCSISGGTYDIFFNDITLQYSFVEK